MKNWEMEWVWTFVNGKRVGMRKGKWVKSKDIEQNIVKKIKNSKVKSIQDVYNEKRQLVYICKQIKQESWKYFAEKN